MKMIRAHIVGVEQLIAGRPATSIEYSTMYNVVLVRQGQHPGHGVLLHLVVTGDLVPQRQYWNLTEARAYASGWNDNELQRS